jgi:hypothetical protein
VSKLLSVYQYIFYKYYRLQRFWFDPAAEYGALACLLIVQGLNLWTLVGLAEWYSGVRFVPPLSSLQTLCTLAALAVPQWFVFIHRARFKRIAQRFARESSRQRLVGSLAVAVYTVLSFVLLIWISGLTPKEA